MVVVYFCNKVKFKFGDYVVFMYIYLEEFVFVVYVCINFGVIVIFIVLMD